MIRENRATTDTKSLLLTLLSLIVFVWRGGLFEVYTGWLQIHCIFNVLKSFLDLIDCANSSSFIFFLYYSSLVSLHHGWGALFSLLFPGFLQFLTISTRQVIVRIVVQAIFICRALESLQELITEQGGVIGIQGLILTAEGFAHIKSWISQLIGEIRCSKVGLSFTDHKSCSHLILIEWIWTGCLQMMTLQHGEGWDLLLSYKCCGLKSLCSITLWIDSCIKFTRLISSALRLFMNDAIFYAG